jgi:hypothetical protein
VRLRRGERKKLLLLVAPTIVGILAIVAVTVYRPVARATLQLKSCSSLSLHVSGAVHPGNLDLVRQFVFTNSSVEIEAPIATVANYPVLAGSAVAIEAGPRGEVVHAVAPEVPLDSRTVTLRPDASGADVRLDYEPQSNRRRFYATIGALAGNLNLDVLYTASPANHHVRVKNARLRFRDTTGNERVMVVGASSVDLTFGAHGDDQGVAAIRARTRSPSHKFASMLYTLEKTGDIAEIIPLAVDPRVTLSKGEGSQAAGEITFKSLDLPAIQYPKAPIYAQGINLTPVAAVEATREGLQSTINGDFTVLQVDDGSGRKHLLPSLLTRMGETWSVLFAALAYLLDKTITVVTFVKGKE